MAPIIWLFTMMGRPPELVKKPSWICWNSWFGSWITRFIRVLLGSRPRSAVRAFISAVTMFR